MPPSNVTAIKAAWSFFKGNYALNFAAIAILSLLALLSSIPLLGLIFAFAYSIFSLSVQIYFAKELGKVQSPEAMEEVAAQTKIGEFLSRELHVATGGFLGLFTLFLLFTLLFMVFVALFGGFGMMQEQMAMYGSMSEARMEQMALAFGVPGAILLLISAVLFYFFPAAMGRMMRQEDFMGGFKATFTLFSPTLWKSTFNKSYFTLIFIWSLVMVASVVIAIILGASVILLPLLLIFAYLVSLYNAAIYLFAVKVTEEA